MLTTSTCPYSISVPSGVSRSLPTLSLARVSALVRSTFSSSSRHCPRDHWRSLLFSRFLSRLYHLHSDTSTILLRSQTSVLPSSHCHKTIHQYAFVVFSNFALPLPCQLRETECINLVRKLRASTKRRRRRRSIRGKLDETKTPRLIARILTRVLACPPAI